MSGATNMVRTWPSDTFFRCCVFTYQVQLTLLYDSARQRKRHEAKTLVAEYKNKRETDRNRNRSSTQSKQCLNPAHMPKQHSWGSSEPQALPTGSLHLILTNKVPFPSLHAISHPPCLPHRVRALWGPSEHNLMGRGHSSTAK